MGSIRFLVTSLQDPSARFRVGVYVPGFRAAGIDAEVLVIPEGGRDRRALFRSLRTVDSVVLLRRLFPPLDIWRLRQAAKRLVYEYDDALVYRDSSRGATSSPDRVLKFGTTVRLADCVVAGNGYLSDLARPFRAPPVVIPTVVDPDAYPPRSEHENAPDARPVVGWIGTRSNFPYLLGIASGLARLAVKLSFKLRIMAEAPVDMPGLDEATLENVPWEAGAESAFLRSLDVGLMPLFEDAWCRGKCGMKALQYMATGVPVLASDVGTAGEVIGEAGLVVRTEDAWCEGLQRLLGDAALRNRMAEAGRARVKAEYSPAVWFDRVRGVYMGEGE